jgi:putative transcriptional regulator
MTRRTFKSDALEAIHSSAADLFKAGAIAKTTLRGFDQSCLKAAEDMPPERIKAIRLANNVSQPVFASYLNISESTVQKWETGAKHPNGAALRLLGLVDQHGLAIFETA